MTQQIKSTTVQTGDTKIVVVQTDKVATIIVKEPDKSATVSHIRSK